MRLEQRYSIVEEHNLNKFNRQHKDS